LKTFIDHFIDSAAKTTPISPIDSRGKEGLTQPAEKDQENPEALEHLRLLSDLLQQDLAPVLKARDGASSGSLRKVSFNNLWHIFKPGQEVRRSGNNQMQL
jgi:hypothetical protein